MLLPAVRDTLIWEVLDTIRTRSGLGLDFFHEQTA
jgi:hypothetical protein